MNISDFKKEVINQRQKKTNYWDVKEDDLLQNQLGFLLYDVTKSVNPTNIADLTDKIKELKDKPEVIEKLSSIDDPRTIQTIKNLGESLGVTLEYKEAREDAIRSFDVLKSNLSEENAERLESIKTDFLDKLDTQRSKEIYKRELQEYKKPVLSVADTFLSGLSTIINPFAGVVTALTSISGNKNMQRKVRESAYIVSAQSKDAEDMKFKIQEYIQANTKDLRRQQTIVGIGGALLLNLAINYNVIPKLSQDTQEITLSPDVTHEIQTRKIYPSREEATGLKKALQAVTLIGYRNGENTIQKDVMNVLTDYKGVDVSCTFEGNLSETLKGSMDRLRLRENTRLSDYATNDFNLGPARIKLNNTSLNKNTQLHQTLEEACRDELSYILFD